LVSIAGAATSGAALVLVLATLRLEGQTPAPESQGRPSPAAPTRPSR
jgi:hypothetical protein